MLDLGLIRSLGFMLGDELNCDIVVDCEDRDNIRSRYLFLSINSRFRLANASTSSGAGWTLFIVSIGGAAVIVVTLQRQTDFSRLKS